MYYLEVLLMTGFFTRSRRVPWGIGQTMGLVMGISLSLFAPLVSAAPDHSGKSKVWIHLRDKGAPPASSQRVEEGKPLFGPYLEEIARAGATLEVELKWQNAVSAWVDPPTRERVSRLDFVSSVTEFPKKAHAPLPVPDFSPLTKTGRTQNSFGQFSTVFNHVGIDSAHALLEREGAMPGAGLTVAIIDADFFLGHASFSSLKNSGRIRDQWDFVAKTPAAVEPNKLAYSHGGSVLSLLAGVQPGVLSGAVPFADYLLYRAEDDASETFVEEDYVAAAIERAVDSGAQVINISLGYRYEFDEGDDHPYAWMDGRTRPASLAALGAARRNVLVVVSVGNLPSQPVVGPSLVSPADADSILAVGIVDASLQHCLYSCTGPAADGRIKPDLASVGPMAGCRVPTSDTRTEAEFEAQAGTSFAAPVIAALAALVWQAGGLPVAHQVRGALMLAGHRAQNPDNNLGYGVPNALQAIALLRSGGLGIRPGMRPHALRGRNLIRYSGGSHPIRLPSDLQEVPGNLELRDARGQSHPVLVKVGAVGWEIWPERKLPRGIYWLKVFPILPK